MYYNYYFTVSGLYLSRFQLRIALFVSILKFYRNIFLNSSYYIVLSVLTIYFKHLNNEIVNNVSGFFIFDKIEREGIDIHHYSNVH